MEGWATVPTLLFCLMPTCPTYQAYEAAKATLTREQRSLELNRRFFHSQLGQARRQWPASGQQGERDAFCAGALAKVHRGITVVGEAHVAALRALDAVEDKDLVLGEWL